MFNYSKEYDVIVVGAGHAGIEAALAAAKIGAQVLLVTSNVDTVGQMSCNPSVGGSAKSHLVREIDALGGEIGRTTDITGIQFRTLNKSKGPAIWATRAQCDKKAYQFRMKWICERQINLDLKQEQVVSFETKGRKIIGITTANQTRYLGKTIIITTGTFLHGLIHIGKTRQGGGRSGEMPSIGISESLKALGLNLKRLKTGTPPRILRSSIDFSKTEEQPGDTPPPLFSFWPHDMFHVEQERICHRAILNNNFPATSILQRVGKQLSCFLTKTTPRTKEIIKENLHLSPMYSGQIEGVGPRYCPSIEDKIVKFSEKETHHIFLEPEGIETDEFYLNGLSTSLPYQVQVQLVRSVVGLENAEILRPAYAVEYDFVPPNQIFPSLESKICENLFLAGQINGTSGYEEAAAQGLIAGMNAARRCINKPPVILKRNEAYIGVMIDDLINVEIKEPYRVFTSRAEYRLLLRQDNADLRLSEFGYDIGLLPRERFDIFLRKRNTITREIDRLNNTRIGSTPLSHLLRRPEVNYRDLPGFDKSLSQDVIDVIEVEIKYQGYIERQQTEVQKLKNIEGKQIPNSFNYDAILGLGNEARENLRNIRPLSLGQAARVPGVSPTDIGLIAIWLKRIEASAGARSGD